MNQQGTIEAVARTGKSFKLEGDASWYGVYNPTDLTAAKGDFVSFEFVEKGQWKNVKGKVMPSAGGTAAPAAGNSAPAKQAYVGDTFPVAALSPKRTINRQNALTNAVNFLKDQETTTHEDVIQMARHFEAYTCGDIDAEEAERAMAEMGG